MVSKFVPSSEQMAKWRAMEAEHTANRAAQERIVMQHVHEFGPRYYPALQRMEAKLKR